MTIHEHLMQTRAICDAATKEPWEHRIDNEWARPDRLIDSEAMVVIRDEDCYRHYKGDERDAANFDFIAHARTALPRFAKALEVAMMGIDGEIGAASCCGRTTQYARLHKLRAEIQAALEGR